MCHPQPQIAAGYLGSGQLFQGMAGLDALFNTLTTAVATAIKKEGGEDASYIAASANAVPGLSIVVNASGAFFYGGSVVRLPDAEQDITAAGIQGNTEMGRLFILLHEFGHLVKANGFLSEGRAGSISDETEKLNNAHIWQHCKKTVLGR